MNQHTRAEAAPARLPYERPTVTVIGAITQLTAAAVCSDDKQSSCDI